MQNFIQIIRAVTAKEIIFTLSDLRYLHTSYIHLQAKIMKGIEGK